MSEFTSQHDALSLIESLLDGTIDDAGFDRLESVLHADAEARALYRSLVNLHAELPGIFGQTPRLSLQVIDMEEPAALLPHEMPHAQLMSLMMQVEAKGEDLDPMALAAERMRSEQTQQASHAVSTHDMIAAGRYLIRHSLTPKVIAALATAAALILGVTLLIVLWGNGAQPNELPLATSPIDSDPASSVVATLTAQHDAQWQAVSGTNLPDVGDTLLAGQRLTLTAGFAEVTTQGGAVATLEAPCTFELIDDNALRLMRGKLVAHVAPKAIGFAVHTPTAHVVDFGTQFGVDVADGGMTHAAVFVGEVELRELADASARPTRSVRLTAGWASQVSDQGELASDPTAVTAADHLRYAGSIDEVSAPGFAYRRAVLASKPMVYWGFDENQASTPSLSEDDAASGQAIGQTGRDAGVIGSALKLAGQVNSMDGFTNASPLKLESTSSYTLEAWYKSDRPHWGRVLSVLLIDPSAKPGWSHLAAVELLGGEHLSQSLSRHAGQARFFHRGEPTQAGLDVLSIKPAPVGQWAHLVTVRDGKSSRLYINGELLSEQEDDQAAVNNASVNLYVGVSHKALGQQSLTDPSVFRAFDGLIDEVAVYDYALKADRIASHYQLGLQQSPLGDE